MLVTNNADINMKNNEGLKPKELTVDASIKKLLQGNLLFHFLKSY
jgi:hypothetical protein